MKKIFLLITFTLFGATSLIAEPLVSTQWLHDNLTNPNIKILDIRNKIDGGSFELYEQAHIPGAVYSNYLEDGWRVNSKDDVPGMLPTTQDLELLVQRLGISNDDHVIIVSGGNSSTDFGSAARIYWTFKTISHENVSILNGGFQSWNEENLPVEKGLIEPTKSNFKAIFTDKYLALASDVEKNISSSSIELVDARPEIQFSGKEKSGVVSRYGTIKSAKNFQQNSLTLPNSSKLKSIDEIEELLFASGLDKELSKITFCNTGHWAAVSWFALSEYLDLDDIKMYDGSMAEWDKLGNEIL